jgi:Tol biopolymer transport system component
MVTRGCTLAALLALAPLSFGQGTTRASVSSNGVLANHGCWLLSMSADGRTVAFESVSTNLAAGDTNVISDIFVRDLQLGTTELVSVSTAGVQGAFPSHAPTISADGRYVAFTSLAANLVPGGTTGYQEIYVRDRLNGTTERVTFSASGGPVNGGSNSATISANGRFVAFRSNASNLVAGDTNYCADIFVRDRLNATTVRVSVDSSGAQADGASNDPSISADGRFVCFDCIASNISHGDTNGLVDVFVRDLQSGITERVSVYSSGGLANGESKFPSISGDGRFVAFSSLASNLVAGDSNGARDVFLHDRLSGTTERVSLDSGAAQGNDDSDVPILSATARFVVFGSRASNLVGADTNGFYDIFVRDRGAPPVVSFCTPGSASAIACPCSNPPAGPDRGCENSSATGGASIAASGSASLAADTLVFATAAERPSATSILIQGSRASFYGVGFGQGVRCVTGSLKRLYVKSASGGSITAPSGADPSVSARSAALGDPILAGEQRFYMVEYRDPLVLGGCPSASTFNATDALDVPWSP